MDRERAGIEIECLCLPTNHFVAFDGTIRVTVCIILLISVTGGATYESRSFIGFFYIGEIKGVYDM